MRPPLKTIAPTRFYSEMIDLTFWQALKRFLKHGKWSWQKVHFRAVNVGEPGYDAAPYEENIIFYDAGCALHFKR